MKVLVLRDKHQNWNDFDIVHAENGSPVTYQNPNSGSVGKPVVFILKKNDNVEPNMFGIPYATHFPLYGAVEFGRNAILADGTDFFYSDDIKTHFSHLAANRFLVTFFRNRAIITNTMSEPRRVWLLRNKSDVYKHTYGRSTAVLKYQDNAIVEYMDFNQNGADRKNYAIIPYAEGTFEIMFGTQSLGTGDIRYCAERLMELGYQAQILTDTESNKCYLLVRNPSDSAYADIRIRARHDNEFLWSDLPETQENSTVASIGPWVHFHLAENNTGGTLPDKYNVDEILMLTPTID